MKIYKYCSQIAPEKWNEFLLDTIDGKTIDGELFPGFTHISMLGSASKAIAVQESVRFYNLIKKATEVGGLKLTPDSKVLDFGCGTGRILRCFTKDTIRDNLYGIDPVEEYVNHCKEKAPCCHFFQINERPPTQFADNTFDLAIAYSVYSHFSPSHGYHWIRELSRIIKPGGMIVVTSYGLGHVNRILNAGEGELNKHQLYQKKVFTRHNFMKHFLKRGEPMFFPHNSSFESGDWGLAFLTPRFIKNTWPDFSLELVYHLDDFGELDQAVFGLKKTSTVSSADFDISDDSPAYRSIVNAPKPQNQASSSQVNNAANSASNPPQTNSFIKKIINKLAPK